MKELSGIFTTIKTFVILFQKDVKFGVNLDITSYTNGKRKTHNPDGRAYSPVVWDFYKVRIPFYFIFNPQPIDYDSDIVNISKFSALSRGVFILL